MLYKPAAADSARHFRIETLVRLVGQARLARADTTVHCHDGAEAHFHDYTEAQKNALAEFFWKSDNVELTTVGIDIGSSTSHLMFARVHLQRKTQLLSSSYIVVDRRILWKSPILLTPFLCDNTIDAARLKDFIDEAYQAAGLAREAIDSGAVILTGEAIKRSNAHAIAQLFAAESGKFVCASAGHHLECTLAAHGSGAASHSRLTHRTVLNVDLGGGTTKFALLQNGELRATWAVAVGGRLIVLDAEGRLARLDESARLAADSLGLTLQLGDKPAAADLERVVETLAEVVIASIRGEPPGGLAQALLLTEPLEMAAVPHRVTFSGGVSEYLFGRETRTFGDIAKPIADRIAKAFGDGRIDAELTDPGNGIRATVIGASQFTVQVSGKTIHIPENAVLPLHNIPVVFPALAQSGAYTPGEVERAVHAAMRRADLGSEHTVALAIRWHGEPHYVRLRGLADGLAAALGNAGDASPLILMIDGDVGRTLGHILADELMVARPVIAIDGVKLQELDYVDIGRLMEPANVVPIVIKSLLFPA
ncbi:MAG: ethanolamine ammonia-lyase reactivating factor EutA, partial [Betaproteobacteria bacterium]|nr:ethanolamine ammonia-lyase reactivating factor EutA [Betaproteobacteria bacterium]